MKQTKKAKVPQSAMLFGHSVPVFQLYIVLVLLSLIFNWFVQFFFYLVMTGHNPNAFLGQKTLIDYTTGYVGDLVLLPILNIGILYVVLHSSLTKVNFLWVGLVGLWADFMLHYLQADLRLTNWSMPRPYDWSFVGYWHMISFFFQISFVALFFYLLLMQLTKKNFRVATAICGVLGVMLIFVGLFLVDYLPMHSLTSQLLATVHHLKH